MKTKVFVTLFVGAVLSACEKEITVNSLMDNPEEISDIQENSNDLVFEGIVEQNAITRTYLTSSAGDDYYTIKWEKGDAISINDGHNTAIYTTDNHNTGSASFEKKEGSLNENSSSFLAFYPSSITKDNQVLPSTQHFVDNGVMEFPMIAKSSNRELHFNNLCGIIRLGLKNGDGSELKISKISIYDDNIGMSGKFTVNYENAAVVSDKSGVVLECERAVTLNTYEATEFNMIVPRGNYSSFKMKIIDSSGREINLAASSTVKVNRSCITNIALNLSAKSFSSSLETITITDSDVNFTAI